MQGLWGGELPYHSNCVKVKVAVDLIFHSCVLRQMVSAGALWSSRKNLSTLHQFYPVKALMFGVKQSQRSQSETRTQTVTLDTLKR